MKVSKNIFLKKWVAGNLAVYCGALGLFHPLIAHGFTGDHDKLLTTPQFIMHTLSLFVFVFFLCAALSFCFLSVFEIFKGTKNKICILVVCRSSMSNNINFL